MAISVAAIPVYATSHDCEEKGGVEVSQALEPDAQGGKCVGSNQDGENPIFIYLGKVITFMTAIFGILLVLMIVISGLQYVLAGASADSAKEAKDRLKNAVTGFILFILMFGILNLLIPDQIFR